MPNCLRTVSFFAASLLLAGCTGNLRPVASDGAAQGGPASTVLPAHRAADSAMQAARLIDETQTVTLAGSTHPLALPEFDQGAIGSGTQLNRMLLLLKPSSAQQAELDALVKAQHDPGSPLYHHWLTPAEFGARFGLSDANLSLVTAWLALRGFTVNEIPASRRLVLFSGNAGQVAGTFHAELHAYRVRGALHIANAIDPQIPASFADVIAGVVTLNDFRRQSQIRSRAALAADPQYSAGSTHYLFPADFATIYDLNSVYNTGIKGAGATIAIAARSNIRLSDVAAFRSTAGLAANNPSVILAGTDPGLVSGDQQESTLDVEWSGAVAPAASVKLVVAASTATTDGVDLAAQYIVNHAAAPIVSMSYGSCEPQMSAAELAFYDSLWEQAASEGISVFVASGDAGAAGCSAATAGYGSEAAVNGLCSSPYSTCVGGTELNDSANPSQYWSSSNSSSYASALGYIPEKVWNESALEGGTGLWASGGGGSAVYAQPEWQTGVSGASAANGMRAVPDVALSAADHDGYFIVENGSYTIVSGTSAATPAFAGIMALIVQNQSGTKQGNANNTLYALPGSGSNPFHTTPAGNNSVPGVAGYSAGGGDYNLATGLGSVDGALLVNGWAATAEPTLSITADGRVVRVQQGGSATVQFTAETGGTFSGAINFSVSGLPSGVTATWSANSITPASSASSSVVVLTLAASEAASRGSFSLTVTAEGDGLTSAQSMTVIVQASRYGCSGLNRLPTQCRPPQKAKSPSGKVAAP
jgi:pseudomonalisin